MSVENLPTDIILIIENYNINILFTCHQFYKIQSKKRIYWNKVRTFHLRFKHLKSTAPNVIYTYHYKNLNSSIIKGDHAVLITRQFNKFAKRIRILLNNLCEISPSSHFSRLDMSLKAYIYSPQRIFDSIATLFKSNDMLQIVLNYTANIPMVILKKYKKSFMWSGIYDLSMAKKMLIDDKTTLYI